MARRKDAEGVIDCEYGEAAHCDGAMVWLRHRGWDLAPLTGQDAPALEAVAHCWKLIGHSDIDGRAAAIWAIASLVDGMQPVAWPMARELAAHALNWRHREEFWPLVVSAYRRRKETSACERSGTPRARGRGLPTRTRSAPACTLPSVRWTPTTSRSASRRPASRSGCRRASSPGSWTCAVAVRVAFSLDPEQDDRESWALYGAHAPGRIAWPETYAVLDIGEPQ